MLLGNDLYCLCWLTLFMTMIVIRLALTKFVLEMSKTAVEKGLKAVCFWCGPLPLIAVHDIQDIQVNE